MIPPKKATISLVLGRMGIDPYESSKNRFGVQYFGPHRTGLLPVISRTIEFPRCSPAVYDGDDEMF